MSTVKLFDIEVTHNIEDGYTLLIDMPDELAQRPLVGALRLDKAATMLINLAVTLIVPEKVKVVIK